MKSSLKKSVLLAALALGQTASQAWASGPGRVDLGSAGSFAILSKAGITNVPTSAVTGDVGVSPITGAANGLTCPEVTGTIYSVDAAGPAPCSIWDATLLTTAVSDMETAYTDAAGRTLPNATELGAGNISGMTLAPGLYKWSSGVLAASDFTLQGGPNDTWIFQIAQDLTVLSGVIVHLSGGAQASNIVWQVAGLTGVTLNTTSHFEGTILAQAAIDLKTGASINGGLLAQTQVTLQSNVVRNPRPSAGSTSFIYPSPVRGDFASIAYQMNASGSVKVRVYNEVGDLVDTVQENKTAGPQTSKIRTKSFAPGVYLYLLTITYDSGSSVSQSVKKFVVIH